MRTVKGLIISFLIITSCGTDIETISIQRSGILTFQVEGYTETWRSTSFLFYPGQSVVKEIAGDPVTSVLFRRYNLVFEGTNPDGVKFELAITLDIGDENQMLHLYSSDYHRRKGGLHQVSLILIEKGNPDSYTMAQVCNETLESTFFEIDRQNNEEEIIAGSFQAELCFTDSPETTINIFNARFKDIKY
jgi:hypothetical protein